MSLNPRLQHWENQRVWIIGASSGIGAALAGSLLARGARVALSARRQFALAAVAAAHPGSVALILPLDITRADEVEAAHAQIVAAWGGYDLVLFVAGDYRPMRAQDFDRNAAQSLFQTNVGGIFNGLSVVIPQLLRQGKGGIGIVASVAGYRGLPKALAYGPSKAALINLAESLYLDLAPQGLGIYLINPGFVATPLTAQNDFTMPDLITPEVAADATLAGLARGSFEIRYPPRFGAVMGVLRLLPYRWYFSLVKRMTGL